MLIKCRGMGCNTDPMPHSGKLPALHASLMLQVLGPHNPHIQCRTIGSALYVMSQKRRGFGGLVAQSEGSLPEQRLKGK